MKPPTYYVLEPRDEPCHAVNPLLWNEFARFNGGVMPSEMHTEALCVQWLDQFYERMGLYGNQEEETNIA